MQAVSRRGAGRLHAAPAAANSANEDEVQKAFVKLQNGSDIRGVAIAGMDILSFDRLCSYKAEHGMSDRAHVIKTSSQL